MTIKMEVGARSGEEFYLDPKAGLDRQEKIKYFDELKEKYLKMLETFSSVEKQCEALEEQVQIKEKVRVTKIGSKLTGFDETNERYEEINNDPSLPEGWKSAWRTHEGFSKGQKTKNFWAPDGRYFGSRITALNFMVTEMKSSKEDVLQMRNGLLEDDYSASLTQWGPHANLPEGWLYATDKKRESDSNSFLSEKFARFRGNVNVLKHLVVHGTEEVLTKFISGFYTNLEVTKWHQSPCLPFPWRVARTRFVCLFFCKKCSTFHLRTGKILVLGTDGVLHSNWKAIRRAMLKEGNTSQDQLIKIQGFIKNLGFKVGKEEPEGDYFGTVENQEKPAQTSISELSTEWLSDPSLPPGWSSQEGHLTGKALKDSKGQHFSGRMDALRCLLRAGRMEELEMVKESLAIEGWRTDEALPQGWMKRDTFKDGKVRRTNYMTPRFETASSVGAAILIMKNSPDSYSEEIINKFKSQNGMNWQQQEGLPAGWTCASVEGAHGSMLKKYMSSDGKFFNSSTQAAKYLQDNQGAPDDMEAIKSCLISDGWFTTSYLPFGWFLRRKTKERVNSGFHYLTPSFDRIKSSSLMLVHLRQEGYGEEAVKHFEDNYESLYKEVTHTPGNQNYFANLKNSWNSQKVTSQNTTVKQEIKQEYTDVSKYQEDDDLPVGWKVYHLNNPTHPRSKNFMSPDEKIFTSVHGVLKYLLRTEGTADAIGDFKKYLTKDGWFETEFLPHGFLIRQKLSERGFLALSPTFTLLKTFKELVGHLKQENYGDHVVQNYEDNFRSLYKDPVNPRVKVKTEATKEPKNQVQVKSEVSEEPLDGNESDDSDESEPTSDSDEVEHAELEWEDVPELPPGWKVSKSTGPEGRLVRRFQSSTGRPFPSLQEVLRYLHETLEVQEAGLELLEQGLVMEGWMEVRVLAGRRWWSKEVGQGSRTYLSPSMEVLTSMAEVRDFMMREGYTEDEVETFQQAGGKPASEIWTDGWVTDPSLPPEWKLSRGPEGTQFQAPGGRVLGSRAQAVKYLTTAGGSQEEVVRMVAGLAHEGWERVSHLPEGWLTKQREDGLSIYLTPNYETLKSVKNVLSYMKLKNYDQENIDRFMKKNSPIKRKAEDCPESEPSKQPKLVEVKMEPAEPAPAPESSSYPLPAGWREEGGSLLGPQGRRFPTRVAAVDWMIRSKTPSEQIYSMWSSLESEGWVLGTRQTSLLPAGWRLQWVAGVRDWQYLDRECRVLRSTEQARGVLVAGKEDQSDPGALHRFDTWAQEVAKEQDPIAWLEEPAVLPQGWRVSLGLEHEILRDHQGARFLGRKEAIDHLIREQYSPSDIFRLWSTLEKEGWQGDESALPTGWKRKWFPAEGRHHYLSPMMEVVRGTLALREVVGRGREYSEGERARLEGWAERERKQFAVKN